MTSVPYSLADEYEAGKLRWAEGVQRPVWRGNAPKKTGVRSARARTRGQNPLVINIYLGYFVCVSVCHNCGTLCYSLSFNNQTDQGGETEGLEREGLEMER